MLFKQATSWKCLEAWYAMKMCLPLRLFLCLRLSLRLCFLEWDDLDFLMSDLSTFSFDRRLFFTVTSFLLEQSLSVKVSSQFKDLWTFNCVCNVWMLLLVMIVKFVGALWTQTLKIMWYINIYKGWNKFSWFDLN